MQAIPRRTSRLFVFLLLILQLGILAHRIEHYLSPAQMECGEDSCAAFAPVPDPPVLPTIVAPPSPALFFVRFWTARDAFVEQPGARLGFRAQAPPV